MSSHKARNVVALPATGTISSVQTNTGKLACTARLSSPSRV
jgi:hypothetical protein